MKLIPKLSHSHIQCISYMCVYRHDENFPDAQKLENWRNDAVYVTDLLCLYTCFRKQYKCTLALPPLFTAPNEWWSHNEHLFNILFSPLCSVCGLTPCITLCYALPWTELPTSFWPSLQGSALQMFLHPLSQHLEITLYYCFNFTVGCGQVLNGGLKYSLNLDIQDTTLIFHSTPCIAIMDSSAPPTCCSPNWPDLRTSYQILRP